jgi:hypothetical protein
VINCDDDFDAGTDDYYCDDGCCSNLDDDDIDTNTETRVRFCERINKKEAVGGGQKV